MTPATHTAPPMRSALEARGMKPVTELARQRLTWLREELGHPKRIARAIGCTEDALRAVLDHPRIKTVPREFADLVEAAYRRLQA